MSNTALHMSRDSVKGAVDISNSSATPLGIGEAFTGGTVDVLNCGIVFINISTDADSAADGLCLCQSSDGVNWDHIDSYTITGGAAKNYSINPHAKYFRIVYTNGAVAQTVFRLQTVLKTQNAKASSHRIKDEISGDDDATLSKSAITGEDSLGEWHNAKVTTDGNIEVVDQSSGLSIAQGNIVGTSIVHKFGVAPSFATANGETVVWDGADSTASALYAYTFSTVADIDRLSSSNNADTQPIELQGLDINGELVVQTVSLTGQTPVALPTPLWRVFRMKNEGVTDLAGRVYCFVDTPVVAGVPTLKTKIRAEVFDGNNQTLMAVYTIPAGKTGYMRSWYAATAGASKTSNYVMRLKARKPGGVFQVKHVQALADTGSSSITHPFADPEVFTEKTDVMMTVTMKATGGSGATVGAGFDIVLVDD